MDSRDQLYQRGGLLKTEEILKWASARGPLLILHVPIKKRASRPVISIPHEFRPLSGLYQVNFACALVLLV